MTRSFTRGAALALLALLGAAGSAHAQDTASVATTPPPASNTATWGDIPQPKLAGFGIDISLSDSTALNALNYSNGLNVLFAPSWSVGSRFLKNTPFKSLTVAGKFSIDRAFAGYDPMAVTPDNGTGPVGGCSAISVSSTGTVDPNSVGRCTTPGNNYRVLPSDLSISVTNPGIYKIPVADVRLNPSVRMTFPTSYQSRYATIVAILAFGAGASRSFLDDKLSVSYNFSFSKYFNRYATPEIQTKGGPSVSGMVVNNYDAAAVAGTNASFYASEANASPPGGFNSNYGFSNSITVAYHPLKKLELSIGYVLSSSFSYAGVCSDLTFNGVTTNPCANADAVAQAGWKQNAAGINIRDSQIFMVSAGYDITNWVSASLQWVTAGPLRNQANEVYQPFISTNYNAFTNLSLGLTFSLGHGDDD